MNRRIRRWMSIVVLGFLAFSQAALVFAACAMDRADMVQMMAAQTDHDCCDDPAPACDDPVPMSVNACVLQSTSDLQAPAASSLVAISACSTTVLFVPQFRPPGPISRHAEPPGAAVPPRILLHSFLI